MNKKQYNNVIEHTLKLEQTEDSLSTARTIFDNMGVALPQGDIKTVYETITTDNYMGWKSCTMQEAQAAADKGVAAIGISEDKIVVISANDEEEPVAQTASVMTLDENTSAFAVDGLKYYVYGNGKGGGAIPTREMVTIIKDDVSNRVIFHSSGKVWRCINQDLVFDNGNITSTPIANRSNHNFYLHWDEDNWMNSNITGYKVYTDDEIKLLYAIDPYGVADYVNRYADTKGTLENKVAYKDDIFRLLFNREPKYFGRNLNGEWGEVSGYIEIDDVLSESETIFGGHRIWDDYTFLQALQQLKEVVGLVCSVIPQLSLVKKWMTASTTFDNVVKIFTFIFGTLANGIVPTFIDSYSPEELAGTPLSWANILVSSYMDLLEFLADAKAKPNCYTRIFDYYIENLNYDINIEFSNGEIYDLERIRDALNMDE